MESVSTRAIDTVLAYLRDQPNHHPQEAIMSWSGDIAAKSDGKQWETQ